MHVTLKHKTSHEGPFLEIEISTSPDSWINNLSFDVWFVMILQLHLHLSDAFIQSDLHCIQATEPQDHCTIFGWDTTTLLQNLESKGAKHLNIEKITFKVVQMKVWAMHITNQKLSLKQKNLSKQINKPICFIFK